MFSKNKTQETNSVIKPLIVSNDEKHALQKMLEAGEDMPVVKSIGFMRINDNSNSWVSYVITTQGDKVLSFEVDEPNLRAIAEETAKINFVNEFMDK